MRPRCAGANLVSRVGLPPFRDRIFVLGWRRLHHALIPLVGVMYTALMNWCELMYDDDEVCFAGAAKDDLCPRGEKLHCGTMSSVERSDAAFGDPWADGRRRLGYVIGFMASSITGPFYLLQCAPKCFRKLVKSSLGGGVDHMPLPGDSYAPFVGSARGMAGLEGRGSCFAHQATK